MADERSAGETSRDAGRTVAEAGLTLREREAAREAVPSPSFSEFRNYRVVAPLSGAGAEADLYRLERDGHPFFLKLYRYGAGPDPALLARVVDLSRRFPEQIVRIEEAGFDETHRRHYEIQELASGTLADLPLPSPPEEARRIARELSAGLSTLHGHGILHLDLKPTNILLRRVDPLDLVFTDFGVSSSLDPETSRRMTGVKGTPLYWSPESFTGVVGREADLFALGMILLERLLGRHPFAGLDTRVITFALATRGVEIPDTVPPDFAALLSGLLARDPRRRFTLADLDRFLAGETLVPPVEDPAPSPEELPHALRLAGRPCRTWEELMLAAASSLPAWDEARAAIGRGTWRAKLERAGDTERAARIEAALTGCGGDPERALARLLHASLPGMPFAVCGLEGTLANLRRCALRASRGEATPAEARVAEMLLSGRLFAQYEEWASAARVDPRGDAAGLLLAAAPRLPSGGKAALRHAALARALEVVADPAPFVFPAATLADPALRAQAVERIVAHADAIPRRDEFARLRQERLLPAGIAEALEGGDLAAWHAALVPLRRLEADGLLVGRARYLDRRGRFLLPGESARLDEPPPPEAYRRGAALLLRLETDELLLTPGEVREYLARNPDALERQETLLADPERYETVARRIRRGVVTAELPRILALAQGAARLPEGEPRERIRRYLEALHAGPARWEPSADRPALEAIAALLSRLTRRARILSLLSPRGLLSVLASLGADLALGAAFGALLASAFAVYAVGFARIETCAWFLRISIPLAMLLALALRARVEPAEGRFLGAWRGCLEGLRCGPPLFAAGAFLYVALSRLLLSGTLAPGRLPDPLAILRVTLALAPLLAALLGAAFGAALGAALGASLGAARRPEANLRQEELSRATESVWREHRARIDAVIRAAP